MQYLKDKGYHSIRPIDLVNYFNQVSLLPSKPILITFDDGYEDFHTDAYPILKQFSLYSVMFLPTGLIENPDYLNWNTLNSINSEGLVEFANHTWSHQQLKTDTQTVQKEISIAHSQLSERGLNQTKTFAYPYGAVSSQAILSLTKLGYQLGFTTKRGTFLCKDNQLTLPRIHIGNLPLSAYGL